MASLDVRRPAAMEQLAVLGRDAQIDTLPVVAGQTPPQIARRALEAGRLGGYDVVMLDTAGRTTLDDAMMSEAAEVKRAANPHEVLLVADALTGQDAVNLARSFDERVGLTGIVLTRVDGDGRGGAALSMRAVTGKPIKLIGTGEKLDALEDFDPARIAGRILGMGDIVALVEKAAANIDAEKADARRREDAQGRLRSRRPARAAHADAGDGRHGRADGHAAGRRQDEEPARCRQSRRQCRQAPDRDHRFDDAEGAPQSRICSRPAARSASPPAPAPRRKRSTSLLKMHRGMADMMKAMGGGKRGPLAGLAQAMGFGGGMPSPEADGGSWPKKMPGGIAARHARQRRFLPPTMPKLPPNMPGLPGLPGLGGKFPGLPGGLPPALERRK